jgi:hypothetical protein
MCMYFYCYVMCYFVSLRILIVMFMYSYCYIYVYLLLCMFRSVYSVLLCCFMYCLCVNVYCTVLYCTVLYRTALLHRVLTHMIWYNMIWYIVYHIITVSQLVPNFTFFCLHAIAMSVCSRAICFFVWRLVTFQKIRLRWKIRLRPKCMQHCDTERILLARGRAFEMK